MTGNYPNWFDRNKFEKLLLIATNLIKRVK